MVGIKFIGLLFSLFITEFEFRFEVGIRDILIEMLLIKVSAKTILAGYIKSLYRDK